MKADNEVGPYKIVTCDDSMARPKRHLVALVHTDLKKFLAQVRSCSTCLPIGLQAWLCRLVGWCWWTKDSCALPLARSVCGGFPYSLIPKSTAPCCDTDTGTQLKQLYGYVSTGNTVALHRNVIAERHVTKFDISNLADYTERPLLKKVPLVSRVSPMINCPGCLNLTDSHLYFQPADINNIQKERITKFALGSILRLCVHVVAMRVCVHALVCVRARVGSGRVMRGSWCWYLRGWSVSRVVSLVETQCTWYCDPSAASCVLGCGAWLA